MTSSRSIVSASSVARLAVWLVLAAVLVAWPAEAAARKRVAVLPFAGPKAEKFQADFEKVVKRRHSVVAAAKWDQTADKLGATDVTDRDLKKVATALNVDAVIVGEVEKRGAKYYLHLELRAGATGKVLHRPDIISRAARLDAEALDDVEAMVLPLLDKLRAAGDGDEEEDADEDAGDDDRGRAKPRGKANDDDRGRAKPRGEDDDEDDDDEDRDDRDRAKPRGKPADDRGRAKPRDDDRDRDDATTTTTAAAPSPATTTATTTTATTTTTTTIASAFATTTATTTTATTTTATTTTATTTTVTTTATAIATRRPPGSRRSISPPACRSPAGHWPSRPTSPRTPPRATAARRCRASASPPRSSRWRSTARTAR
jgi:hypothetical protein